MGTFRLKPGDERNAVKRAAAYFGGWTAFAKALNTRYNTNVKPCAIYVWGRKGKVDQKYLQAVSDLTGISQDELRPGYLPKRRELVAAVQQVEAEKP